MEHRKIELANGLHVLHTFVPYTRAVHCGYVINAGSRHDRPDEAGMAHFIEHMIFKGTVKRKTFHVLNYLESVGGEINAYTSKENICFYASMASEYVDRATDLLTDIAFHSTFPAKEIEKEKQVISEEIDMYRNAPDEAIFEDFDELTFPNHSLGHPILGTRESIRGIDRARIQAFVRENFVQGAIVYSIVGNVSAQKVDRLIDKYLKELELPPPLRTQTPPPPMAYFEKEVPIMMNQTHEILGGRAYGMKEDAYVPFMLLTNMLGGPAMNSRLNLNIREKHGLSYNISSFYSPYTDSGSWGIYYACEPRNRGRILRLIEKELAEVRDKKLGSMRLSQAKKQLIGQLTLSYENLLSQMLGNAKEVLNFGDVIPFSDYVQWVENVTASDVLEVANDCFHEQKLSRLLYQGTGKLNGVNHETEEEQSYVR